MTVLACLLGLTVIIGVTMAAGDGCQENHYWNGTNCTECSTCPRGFGRKKKCTSIKDTHCIPCWPGFDYSNTTGFESCIHCDKHSNCLPGKSKKIKNCTIFSPPVCDGCEDGYYRDNQVKPNGGCVQCSPRCNILQVEIISCTTKHDRKCKEKEHIEIPILGVFRPTSPDKRIPNSTPYRGKVVTTLSAEGTPYTASILLDQNGEYWGGVIGGVVLLALAVAVLGIIWKMCSTRRKHHATAGNDTLNRQQRRTLIKSAKFDLDSPVSNLSIEGRRFITQKLNGKFHDDYFYWEIVAGKLDLRAECEAWKNAQNPAERVLKAYGEKEGSTLRKLVKVLRDPEVDLTHFASEIETHFSDQGKQENVKETQV